MSARRTSTSAISAQKKRRAADLTDEQPAARDEATKRRRKSIAVISVHDQLVERAAHHRPETRHRPGSEDVRIIVPEEEEETVLKGPTRTRNSRQSLPSVSSTEPPTASSKSRRKSTAPAEVQHAPARVSAPSRRRSSEGTEAGPVHTPRPPFAAPAGRDASRIQPSTLALQSLVSDERPTPIISAPVDHIPRAVQSPVAGPLAVADLPTLSETISVPRKHTKHITLYLIIIVSVSATLFVICGMIARTTSGLIDALDMSGRRLATFSTLGRVDEWEWGVPAEHVTIVKHAEEVINQQRDALNHWHSRHYGAIEPALKRIERQIGTIRKRTKEILNSRKINAAKIAGQVDQSEETLKSEKKALQNKLLELVNEVSGYVRELEAAFRMNALELPVLEIHDTVAVVAEAEECELLEGDQYYNCLLSRLKTSVARINSLQAVLVASASASTIFAESVEEMEFFVEEKESDITLLLSHGRALMNDLNVRISIDEETIKKAEQYSMGSNAASESEGNGTSVTATRDVQQVLFSVEDEEERIKESLGNPIRAKIRLSASDIMKESLGPDVDVTVRTQLGHAVEEALNRREETIQGRVNDVREYLKGKTEVSAGVNMPLEDRSDDDQLRRLQIEAEKALDDHIAEIMMRAEEVGDDIKVEVNAVINEVLTSSGSNGGDSSQEEDLVPVKSEEDIVMAISDSSRHQQLVEVEELKRAASYARGNIDVAVMIGDLDLMDAEEVIAVPSEDSHDTDGPFKNDLTKFKDYAVGPRGGKVFVEPVHLSTPAHSSRTYVLTSGPYRASKSAVSADSLLYHSGLVKTSADPQSVLSHAMPPEPGHCYAFSGSSGNITVMMHSPVDVFGVGVYHIPLSETTEHMKGSAPRRFAVYGWISKPVVQGMLPGLKRVVTNEAYFLGDFIYRQADDSRTALQTFNIARTERGAKDIRLVPPFSAVTFAIADNHGNDQYTCVYRLQVLGELSRNY